MLATKSIGSNGATSQTTGNPCHRSGPAFGKFGSATPLARTVIYLAKFAHTVYVLHCFQNKAQRTPRADIDLAATRYRDLLKELQP